MRTRDTNLDLLRAAAIVLVVCHHLPQRWPVDHSAVLRATGWMEAGVDLFFVLSGWLIGGLFWQEHARFGDVELGRFVGRRALRTMPPYLVALAIAYSGVFLARREPFDWRYLCFLQNYSRELPFFRVSWSLCIEEHFYLVMPLGCLCLWRYGRRPEIWLLLLALVPGVCRALSWYPGCLEGGFGYHRTATHLHCEGLILGVWAAFVRVHRPAWWTAWRRAAPSVLAASLVLTAVAMWLGPSALQYGVRLLLVAVACLSLLSWMVERAPVLGSDARIVFWVATTSYSVYLVHLPALELGLRLMNRLPRFEPLWLAVDLGLVAAAGAAFYWLVETPSLNLRHRLVPGRTHERSPLRDAQAAVAAK